MGEYYFKGSTRHPHYKVDGMSNQRTVMNAGELRIAAGEFLKLLLDSAPTDEGIDAAELPSHVAAEVRRMRDQLRIRMNQ